MSRLINLNCGWDWYIGLEEFVEFEGLKFPLTYTNNKEFIISKKVPQEVIEEIKKINDGSFLWT
jgi:hypothetical protein